MRRLRAAVRLRCCFAASGVVAWAGCAGRAAAPAAAGPRSDVIVASPIVVTPGDEADRRATFERARLFLLAGKAEQAAALFDEVARADAAGPLAAASIFDSGIAWEESGHRDVALERFQSAVERFGPTDVGRAAALRVLRLLAYLERWSLLAATADLLLARPDLTDVERLEAYGAQALAVVEAGDPDSAERFIAKGRDIIDALRLGEGGKLPMEAAQIMFALGEARRLRSERITFVPLPAGFSQVLEQRCQGLLDAQSAYTDAMRSYDAHWAAMSGYWIGRLYQRLHDDLLAIAPPGAADTRDKKRLFQGAMRLRYRVLLEKGLAMMAHTVMLGERTGESSPWIDRARAAKREMEQALAGEKEFLATLPYSERELERALADLAAKAVRP